MRGRSCQLVELALTWAAVAIVAAAVALVELDVVAGAVAGLGLG